ncbi:methyltransferase domain-containing protein [Salinibacter grassmerensis]|uniref:methyltransferase domain-containing protein n=1 Tax=Salinibacter grassmerensis TaxID=3040353 RepID=UPI0021E70EE6|nr:methyltransferase domain-containing protein [Salinibacter grassmerensis]
MPSSPSVLSLRSSDRTPLLFTVNMGLEDVVVDEFRERAAAAGLDVTDTDDTPFGLQSYALVEVDAAPDDALDVARQMRSVHHVLAPLYTFTLSTNEEDALQAIQDTVKTLDVEAMETADTFRASSVRQGDHDFTSVDVQRWAGGALDARYDASVDLEDYDVEVRVDVREDQCLVSVQHTREALSRRQLEGYQPRAALKANVAYALLRLAHLDAPPDTLLDPFCGSATILLEAADLWGDTQCYGNDWNEEAVTGARTNVEMAGLSDRITIREGDAWQLEETFEDVTADLIVTNPPFGVRMASSMDFYPFYRRVLGQMAEVLRPGGLVVMLVLRQGPFNTVLDESEQFASRHVRAIEIGGLYPYVFVLERL